ncbi:glutathione S-transferase family protein [Sphingomonas astaxanthinifaciens]|uniref:Glutathione S-transferase n=1 Tax=Sphingomonas astaxanthinifaciens DSM 22298 TaxID=1123267 RepID=A0ABQ5Z290_9SPHN|nr:glutathione S-transferase family protein [Sphingomonas astaxanthinifaciens]GLR46873.1 glutathione S-transferase [Sphingomonas astaxanthinifaciens DSM 22298]
MTDLTFYTNPQSRGQIVRWMLEEVGAPYETVILDYATTLKGDEYRAINPMMKIPAIRHRGKVVTEVAAICAYLADAFPDAGLAPAPADRADYYRYLFFASGPLEMTFSLKAINYDPPADKQRMFGHGNEALVFEALETMLGDRDYVTGRFSAADLVLASQLGFMMMFGMIEGSDTLKAYVARCTDRDAWRRAKQIDTDAGEALKAAAQAAAPAA